MKKYLLLIICLFLLTPSTTTKAQETYKEIISQYTVKLQQDVYTQYTTGFTYSDAMLFSDATQFSSDITKISIALAAGAYNQTNVSDLLDEMDFSSKEFYNYNRISTLYDNDFVAYSIATKEITFNGENYIIYCIPIRGTSESAEWFSNFNLGTNGNHTGFYLAANEVMSQLESKVVNDGYNSNNRILLMTGHSRGAAVSNIITGIYTNQAINDDNTLFTQNHIFGYTFACPSVSKNANTTYTNIYNFNNIGDIIPELPREQWGYKRYGQTKILDLNHYDNVAHRFNDVTSSVFSSPKSTTAFFDEFSQIIPSESEYYSESNQMLFKTLAYFLGGYKDVSGDEFLKYLGINDDGWLISYIGNYMSPSNMSQLISILDSISGPSKARGLFDDWFSKLEQMQNYYETAQKLSEVIKKASRLLNAGEFDENKGTLVAHKVETYVLWVNSEYYGYEGWKGNPSLNEVTIPDDITSISADCFTSCTNLETVVLPNSITHISDTAFKQLDSKKLKFFGDEDHYNKSRIQELGFKYNPSDIIIGDVNEDDIVNLKDSILLGRYNAGWDIEINLDAADLDQNGLVNLKDSILLDRYNAGWQK